jgi:cell division septation protein DedD
MPTTDYASEIALPDSQAGEPSMERAQEASDEASKPLKGLFFGFAITVTIGLGLASWYVGVRIASPDEVASAAPSAAAPPAATITTPKSVAGNSMADAYWYTVPPAQFYLQAGGLGPKRDAAFVRSLGSKGFHAQVQARDSDDARILIGPFTTHAELERAQRRLQASGVLAVETAQ